MLDLSKDSSTRSFSFSWFFMCFLMPVETKRPSQLFVMSSFEDQSLGT